MKTILNFIGVRIASIIANFVIVGLLFLGFTQFNKWFGVEDDHPVEELAEALLQSEIGLDVDFTTVTPEEKV